MFGASTAGVVDISVGAFMLLVGLTLATNFVSLGRRWWAAVDRSTGQKDLRLLRWILWLGALVGFVLVLLGAVQI